MGKEAECAARFSWVSRGKRVTGKALLETEAIVFRGDVTVTLARGDITEAGAHDGVLHVRTKEGEASFELGETQAARWAKAILDPPTLLDKLGIKAGVRVAVLGDLDEAFLDAASDVAEDVAGELPTEDTDVVLLGITSRKELPAIAKLKAKMRGDAALWVVYPKGKKDPTEDAVLEAGRAAGMKDTKVARFSDTHTALRFVVPVADRKR